MIIVAFVVIATTLILSVSHKKLRMLAAVLVVSIIIVASALLIFTGDDLDRCLDAGGSWSAARSECRFSMADPGHTDHKHKFD